MLPLLGLASDPASDGDRIAFFQSRGRLVPEDVDDTYDVYRWRNGELSLLSRWASDTDGAFYAGNDRSGKNVYLATLDRLSWQDHDAVLDVYSARAGGGVTQPAPPALCEVLADACQSAGAVAVAVSERSSTPAGSELRPGRRVRLRVAVSRAARRKAARRGALAVRVRTARAGRVSAVARARIGRKRRVVGREAVRVPRADRVTVRLALSRAARRRSR